MSTCSKHQEQQYDIVWYLEVLFVVVVLFFLLRAILLWFFKHDKILSKLNSLQKNMDKINAAFLQ